MTKNQTLLTPRFKPITRVELEKLVRKYAPEGQSEQAVSLEDVGLYEVAQEVVTRRKQRNKEGPQAQPQ